jgi:hypothetical protein
MHKTGGLPVVFRQKEASISEELFDQKIKHTP